ncbi:hypothetical protein DSL72_009103 [Monilinia vaccinii-corymbosi]|uniref:DUF4604 domain-containing protein n=1 Tax=Monilinia vaccinii-corymbosi TaxID=61207 RepID=A0A8A3PQ77_9HELO|nr:hypothetical protein DSL72_009103 [Monilinia vaccinii-corymbosi]
MSHPKITPKNLTYDSTLPPFLQRLQANHPSNDGRHEFRRARPTKPRDEDEERESEPVVFDEATGETLSREEWERRAEKAEGGEEEEEKEEEEQERKGEATKAAVIGVSKKRKVGKVIGRSEDEDEKENGAKVNDKMSSKKDAGKPKSEESDKAGAGEKKKTSKIPAKKGKKIKLSFGDEE